MTGLVLCGGESRRMGRDKARIELSGRTLLEAALAALEPVAHEIVLACGSAPRYEELGKRLVLDAQPGAGPLAGLAAGLAGLETEWLVAVACDMPRVDPRLFRTLLAAAEAHAHDVCVFANDRGVEPLCGVYRRTCRGPVSAALARGERRVTSFWSEPVPDGRALSIGRIRTSDLPEELMEGEPFTNLNTPEELERERHAEGEGP